MAETNLMQKSLDYIEDHLKSELALGDIAAQAGFSTFHFCRIFQHTVGMPVMAYVQRRRLTHAAYRISKGQSAVQSALEYGFDTYAGFYKAFVQAFDHTPGSFKGKPMPPPYKIDLQKGADFMFSNSRLQAILTQWGLTDASFAPVQYENSGIISDSAWYVGQEYVLKATRNIAGFKIHTGLAKALVQGGMSAPVPITTPDGREFVQEGDLYFYLLPRLAGKPVNSRSLMEKDWSLKAEKLGSLLGRLHQALSRFDKTVAADDTDHISVLRDWAMPKTKAAMSLPTGFKEDFLTRFPALYERLPRHLIHRDINPANILMQGDEFSGFIDFELAERSIRLYDPCYLSTAILSETFSDEAGGNDRWFEVYQSILRGYGSVCPLTREEREAAPYVVFTIQMICIAYFSEHSKYQALAETNKRMLLWLLENKVRLGLA